MRTENSTHVLSRSDFDEVVLAIPVGAFKPLNASPGPCAELIEASRSFKQMTNAASLVPTISFQAWCTQTLEDMGWRPPLDLAGEHKIDFPMSNGPSPLNIWADRTVVLHREHGRKKRLAPKSLEYLCDAFETSLYKAPADCVDVPKIAKACARRLAVEWLEQKSHLLWPRTSHSGAFDWDLLFDPEDRTGEKRIDYQVIKANVDLGVLRGFAGGIDSVASSRRRFRVRPSLSRGRLDRHRVQYRMHRVLR